MKGVKVKVKRSPALQADSLLAGSQGKPVKELGGCQNEWNFDHLGECCNYSRLKVTVT